MRIIIIIAAAILLPSLILGQGNVSSLDKINGFKRFKYGDNPQKHSAFIKEETLKKQNNSSRIREFWCYDSALLDFGIKFKEISLFFIDNKLYKISLWTYNKHEEMQEKMDAGITLDVFLINDELEKLFDKPLNGKTKKDIAGEYVYGYWETQLNNLEYSTMNSVTGEMFLEVIFYNKKLNNAAESSKYE